MLTVLAVPASAPPTAASLLTRWHVDYVAAVLLLAAAGLYAWGMVRVRRRHPTRPWPPARAAAFYAGLGVVALALMSIVAVYDTQFFWVHMIQHLMLIMVAPGFLVAGRPLTLLLHASRNPLHTAAKRVLRSRLVTVITSPLFAIPFYAAVVVVTHLTAFNNVAVTHRAARAGELAAYLIAGYLYFLPGFGDEPIRWRMSYPAKLLIILLVMPIDTFTGVALLMTSSPPWPVYAAQHHTFGPSPLTDVHWGGAMMWVGGDTIMVVIMAVVLFAWITGRDRKGGTLRWVERARRANLDRYLAASPPAARAAAHGDVDEDQVRLDAYNAWLAQIAARQPPRE